MATEAFKRQIVSNPHASDEEAAQFLATNEWRYFERYWRPILPARVWTVLSVLHDHIRFDKTTWQKRETCWPSQAEIAERAHMNERTVNRILRRDVAGRFTYTYRDQVYWIAAESDVARYVTRKTLAWQQAQARREQQAQAQTDAPTRAEATATTPHKAITCPYQPGQLIAGKLEEIPEDYSGPVYALGDLMALFVNKVDPRFHYNQGVGRWERTSNIYHVAAILPAVPDINAKNTLMITLADVRAARAKMQDEAAEQALSPASIVPTNWRVGSTDKLTDEATTSKPRTRDRDTSITPEGEQVEGVVGMAIGNTDGDEMTGTTRPRSSEADRIDSEPDKSAAPRRSPAETLPAGVALTEGQAWRADARGWLDASRLPARPGEKKGPTILEHHMNQFNVENTAKALADLLSFAVPRLAPIDMPVELLGDLAEYARRRANIYVWRTDPATNEPKCPNPGGYFLGVLHSLIDEYTKARDVSKLDKKTSALERSAIAKERAEKGQPATPPKPRPTRSDRAPRAAAPARPASQGWGGRELSHDDKLKQALYRNSQ